MQLIRDGLEGGIFTVRTGFQHQGAQRQEDLTATFFRSAQVFTTKVTSASRASSEATAKAAVKS